mgnify:CR=1
VVKLKEEVSRRVIQASIRWGMQT